jgi:xanthosine utilization system XapX-like protein
MYMEVRVNAFSIVLFIHVLSAIALFIAIALEGFLLVRLRSARDREELQFPVRAFRRLGVIYGPAFLGLLLGGIYLAAKLGSREAWIPLALGATLLMAVAGGLMTGRRMSRLRKVLTTITDSSESLLSLARSKALVVSYGVRAGLAVGIVFLMSTMPSLLPSLGALGAGSVAGILLAFRFQSFTLRVLGRCNYTTAGTTQATQRS